MITKLNISIALFLGSLIVIQSCNPTPATYKAEVPITQNYGSKDACSISAKEFASWFKDGKIKKDGLIMPANSLSKLDSDCEFYKWSWRMFLWTISQTGNGNGDYVFNAKGFFDLLSNDSLSQTNSKIARAGKFESVEQAGLGSFVFMSNKTGLTPDGSIVYYAIHVNDVFAYFASGKKQGEFKDIDKFLTTQKDLTTVVNYAKNNYDATIKKPNALTMELKSSWIKIDPKYPSAKHYLTLKADIPKYEKDGDQKWTWDGTSFEKNVTMALVGFHVAGSTIDHPEMVWATFEHQYNAPDKNYEFIDSEDDTVSQINFMDDGYLTSEQARLPWVFFDSNSRYNQANDPRMSANSSGTITAETDKTIGPGNTVRTHPWGQTDNIPDLANNSSLLSINKKVRELLKEGDIRNKYMLIGSTWTNGTIPGIPRGPVATIEGSQVLANTTMETYFQKDNCFSCHQGGKLNGLSHIYGRILPLSKN